LTISNSLCKVPEQSVGALPKANVSLQTAGPCTSVAIMKGARESPSLISGKTLPTVNSDLVVHSVSENELLEAFSRPADEGSFF